MPNNEGRSDGNVASAWAKSPNRPGAVGSGWLSLIDHSIDVASVAAALLRLPTVRKRLATLAERPLLSDRDVVRLCFFVGLHDAGKVNHGFQAKLRGERPFAGHIGPLWAILGRTHHSIEAYRTIRRDLSRALTAAQWRSWVHHDQDAERGCFSHQLLLPRPYLVLTKPLRLDIQCQRAASVKIGWKYLDD